MADKFAEFLFINNNNTRTKFALSSREGLVEHRAIETSSVSVESVTEATKNWVYDRVVIASVVPRGYPYLN